MRLALLLLPLLLAGQSLTRQEMPPALSEATRHLQRGRNREAIAVLQSYLKTDPKNPAALRLLALSSLRDENYPAARDYAAKVSPPDAATLNILGMAQVGLQDTASAVRSFQQAIRLNAGLAEAYLQLGLLYTNQQQNLPEALRLLEKALSLKPDLNGAHTALGAAQLASGKPDAAVVSLEHATRLDPQSAESFYQLASAYRKLNRPADAAAALSHFSELSRKRADERARDMRSRAAYEQALNLLTTTEQYEQAFELFQKSAQDALVPDAPYYRMAQILYLKGNDDAALKLIREAIRLSPDEPEYYFVLARALQATDKNGALTAVRTALSLRPGVADFLELEAELLRR